MKDDAHRHSCTANYQEWLPFSLVGKDLRKDESAEERTSETEDVRHSGRFEEIKRR